MSDTCLKAGCAMRVSDEHSVKAKVKFDPKELQKGDRVWANDVSLALLASWNISDASCISGDVVKDNWIDQHIIILDWSGIAATKYEHLRCRITSVVRNGKQIYPVEVPKLKVGDWRQWTGFRIGRFCVEAVGERYYTLTEYPGPIRTEYQHKAVEENSTPCARFKVGDVVEAGGSRFVIATISKQTCEAELYTMNGNFRFGFIQFHKLTLITPAPVKE